MKFYNIFLLLLIVVIIGSCISYPGAMQGDSFVLVKDSNNSKHLLIDGSSTYINTDFSENAKYYYFSKNACPKEGNSNIPSYLFGSKVMKMTVLVHENNDINKSDLEEMLLLANKLINDLAIGINVKISGDIKYFNDQCNIYSQFNDKFTCILNGNSVEGDFYLVLNPYNREAINNTESPYVRNYGDGARSIKVIVANPHIMNAVVLAHEILHYYYTIDSNIPHNIMHDNSPFTGSVYTQNGQLMKLVNDHGLPSELNKENGSQSHVNHRTFETSLISFDDFYDIEDNSVATIENDQLFENTYSVKNNKTTISTELSSPLPHLIHPETISNSTIGFGVTNLNKYTAELIKNALPKSIINYIKPIYKHQFKYLKELKFENRKKNWSRQLFLKQSPNIIMSEDKYVKLSIDNFKKLRRRNLLYWLAKRDKLGGFNDMALLQKMKNNTSLYNEYLKILNL